MSREVPTVRRIIGLAKKAHNGTGNEPRLKFHDFMSKVAMDFIRVFAATREPLNQASRAVPHSPYLMNVQHIRASVHRHNRVPHRNMRTVHCPNFTAASGECAMALGSMIAGPSNKQNNAPKAPTG